MNLRDSIHWDRQFEQELPDCRLSGTAREHKTIRRGNMEWERVYCASCSKPAGFVTAEWTPHIFYVCTECVPKIKGNPNIIEVPMPPGTTVG